MTKTAKFYYSFWDLEGLFIVIQGRGKKTGINLIIYSPSGNFAERAKRSRQKSFVTRCSSNVWRLTMRNNILYVIIQTSSGLSVAASKHSHIEFTLLVYRLSTVFISDERLLKLWQPSSWIMCANQRWEYFFQDQDHDHLSRPWGISRPKVSRL